MKFDIGVMPLSNNKWAKGKCGFKALQYMSLGIPTVASPVGVNIDIINEGENGFLCDTQEEWLTALTFLLIKEENRTDMSESAKQKIKDEFSVLSNKHNFLSLFNI
jgi:glycosyltransferase involved in cell wall biosynthesis